MSDLVKPQSYGFNIENYDYIDVEYVPQRQFHFAMILALILHVAVILSVSFTIMPKRTLDPVFSLNIAMVEQEGGEPERASGENQPPVTTVTESNDQDAMAAATPKPQDSHSLPVLTTPQLATHRVEKPAAEEQPVSNSHPEELRSAPLKLSQVQPEVMNEVQPEQTSELPDFNATPHDHTNRVREKYINPEETATLEGFYAESWRLKVEHVATLNYPKAAQRLKLVGKLTLDVAIRADGTVHSVELVRSSGHEILDNAARQIVLLAAPYEPFSEELRKRYDILHIIRTWEFDQGDRLSSVDN